MTAKAAAAREKEIVMLATVPMSVGTAGSAYQLSRILTKSRIFERPHDMIH